MKKKIQYRIRSKWCFALLLAVFSVTTYGQQSVGDRFNVDGITYKIAAPTEVKLVGYTSTAKKVTISGNVELIGLFAFEDNLDLVTVEANDPLVFNNLI